MPKNTTKLKIGFVLDDGLDKPDGVQQYVLTLGKWLKKQGHEVRYLVGETKRKDLDGVISLSRNLKVRFNGNSLSTPLPARSRKIKQIIHEQKFDVVHVQVPYSPFMAAKVVKNVGKGTKIIGTFHILPVGKLQSVATRLLGYSLRGSLKKFDYFLSVSTPAQTFAKQSFGINSEVLPNPVDISKFKGSGFSSDRTINIIYLGRLVPRKGCLQLVKAVDELLKENKLNIKLHICGTGPLQNNIQNYISSSPRLKPAAQMHGFVSETDKIKFLNQADFAVFPSLGGESFGIVLIEAMAAGAKVVLAGNNPGYASVMEDLPQCLFNPNDPIELKNKLNKLINNKSEAKKIHKKQQQMVLKYDVNVVGQRLLQLYKN